MKKLKKPEKVAKKKRKLDPDFLRFMETVPVSSDPVTMILRCHLLAEYYIDRLIVVEIKRGDIIIDSRLQFYDKLMIVRSLDVVPNELIDSLEKLNATRNSCSHVLDYEISENDIDKIGRPLGKDYISNKKRFGSNKSELLHSILLMLMANVCGIVGAAVDHKLGKHIDKKKNSE